MPSTFSAISTVTVGAGGVSSITFTSIPQIYTDLLIKISGRITRPGVSTDIYAVNFNGTTTNETCRRIEANGSAVYSANNALMFAYQANGTGATANVFGNGEFYIPNYTGSINKAGFSDGVSEDNTSTAYMGMSATLWSNTAAITSIELFGDSGTGFTQYSTATLYGIKNT